MAERPARQLAAGAALIIWAAGCTGCVGVTTVPDSAGGLPVAHAGARVPRAAPSSPTPW